MEELHEHREWMKSIPGMLEDKKDDMASVMDEFNLLDEFLFNLNGEDFGMKWGLLSWPWKVANMVEQVEAQHAEEEERLKKLQMQDTASLNDKMDTLIMNVAGLSGHCHLEKAHEVANDCRRLNRALRECQELATVYNNRERLFGLATTNVSAALFQLQLRGGSQCQSPISCATINTRLNQKKIFSFFFSYSDAY